jgi:hypothetical protein
VGKNNKHKNRKAIWFEYTKSCVFPVITKESKKNYYFQPIKLKKNIDNSDE